VNQEQQSFSEDSVLDGSVQPDHTYKVIVIGESGVGKSNILNRWIKGNFGIDLAITTQSQLYQKLFRVSNPKNHNPESVAVQLWDTAGQERFLSITRQFYRNAKGVVIVYDTTARVTFNAIQKWYNVVTEEIDIKDVNIILIGNKTDLVNQREVESSEGINFASKNYMSFLETSALDGSNCNKALQILLQEVHAKQTVNSLTNAHNSETLERKNSTILSNEEAKSDGCPC